MAARRIQLSKKIRFDVFKRDSFVCQYCGNSPPAVVLEIDHIDPVSNGGGNEIDNLITSCFDCNRGKGRHSLGSIPATFLEKIETLKEREIQIKEYEKLLSSIKRRKRKKISSISSLYEELDPGYTLNGGARRTVEMFLDKLTVDDVEFAMRKAFEIPVRDSFKYFCGICWNMIKARPNG